MEIRLVGRFENPFRYILKEEVERAYIFKDGVWVKMTVGEELQDIIYSILFPKFRLERMEDKQVLIVTKVESNPSRVEEIIKVLNRDRRRAK